MGTVPLMIEGQHLQQRFGEGKSATHALRDVSIAIRQGELALIMGPSGSGKSTLLAALSGLMRPQEGRVLALGQDLWGMSDARRKDFRREHFGFIFQGYNLFPALSARQQMEIVLHWASGVPFRERRDRVAAMLNLLGLGGKEYHRPEQLSGGEKQRVAIGRALIKQPAVCFADEPTSALDWERGRQVMGMLTEAARSQGTAVLIVSHDPRLMPFVDRIFLQEEGALRETTGAMEMHPFPEVEVGGGI